MEQGEVSRVRIETQLHEWGADLEKLTLKVDKEIAEAKKEYCEHRPAVGRWGDVRAGAGKGVGGAETGHPERDRPVQVTSLEEEAP
jgi:hypothetical protein